MADQNENQKNAAYEKFNETWNFWNDFTKGKLASISRMPEMVRDAKWRELLDEYKNLPPDLLSQKETMDLAMMSQREEPVAEDEEPEHEEHKGHGAGPLSDDEIINNRTPKHLRLTKAEQKELKKLRKMNPGFRKTQEQGARLIQLEAKMRHLKEYQDQLRKELQKERYEKLTKGQKAKIEKKDLAALKTQQSTLAYNLSAEEQLRLKALEVKYKKPLTKDEQAEQKAQREEEIKQTQAETDKTNEFIRSYTAVPQSGIKEEESPALEAKKTGTAETDRHYTALAGPKIEKEGGAALEAKKTEKKPYAVADEEQDRKDLEEIKKRGFNKSGEDLLKEKELEKKLQQAQMARMAQEEEQERHAGEEGMYTTKGEFFRPGEYEQQQRLNDLAVEQRGAFENSFENPPQPRPQRPPQQQPPQHLRLPRRGSIDRINNRINKIRGRIKKVDKTIKKLLNVLKLLARIPWQVWLLIGVVVIIILLLLMVGGIVGGSPSGTTGGPSPAPSISPVPPVSADAPDIIISCTPATAKVGSKITCSIVVTNKKSSTQKVEVTYLIPTGLATIDNSSLNPAPTQIDNASGEIIWDLSLVGDGSQTVTLSLTATQDNTPLPIAATVSYDGSSDTNQAVTQVCIGDTGSTTCTGNSSGLSLLFTQAPDQINNGGQIEYKLTGKNEGTDPVDFTIVDAVPDNATAVGPKQQDFANVEPGGTRDFYITLTPKGIDTYIFNFACIMITGSGGTCVNPNSFTTSPNNNDCNGAYSLANPEGNFGDQNCEILSQNDANNKLEPVLRSLDPTNANAWLLIMQGESGTYPHGSVQGANAYNRDSTSGKGAYGLFQMNPQGRGNGQFDAGDVNWRNQVQNALEYNSSSIIPNGQTVCDYWQVARNLGLCFP